MRGEHSLQSRNRLFQRGSSPHARGAPMVRPPYLMTQGIISACAGSTSRRNCATCGSGDHPRMRGEHLHGANVGISSVGSSPHARGAQARRHRLHRAVGIIPACAGSTRLRSDQWFSTQDHPRMRGEHWYYANWIIPACAGSTSRPRRKPTPAGDHPRMRGEHQAFCIMSSCAWGSSPHARGALQAVKSGGRSAGIIPACAGSTASVSHFVPV